MGVKTALNKKKILKGGIEWGKKRNFKTKKGEHYGWGP